MTTEKLMETIRSVNPGRYDCKFSDIVAIRDAGSGEAVDTGADCFYFGFLQGQKAAKAETRRKAEDRRRREMEKHAPGYGILTALIEKNMSNEYFIRIVAAFARGLDGCADREEATPHE